MAAPFVVITSVHYGHRAQGRHLFGCSSSKLPATSPCTPDQAKPTLKQRIREIGIRRSFGATANRVFFPVMMESVVATVVAGVVGVIVAVLIVKNPIVEGFIGQGTVSEFPPFPVEAAVLGLVLATVVRALAGLLPALLAVRVKVIDAIRY
jgi:putative ABC transport system permease protein